MQWGARKLCVVVDDEQARGPREREATTRKPENENHTDSRPPAISLFLSPGFLHGELYWRRQNSAATLQL